VLQPLVAAFAGSASKKPARASKSDVPGAVTARASSAAGLVLVAGKTNATTGLIGCSTCSNDLHYI
jgi:hypothetical protein